MSFLPYPAENFTKHTFSAFKKRPKGYQPNTGELKSMNDDPVHVVIPAPPRRNYSLCRVWLRRTPERINAAEAKWIYPHVATRIHACVGI